MAGSLLLYGPLILVLGGPLAFGAVSPLPIFVLQAGAALLFSIWIIHQARAREIVVSWNPAFAPMLAFLGLIVVQLASGHTAYRAATFSECALYVTYGLLCFLIVQTPLRTSQLRSLSVTISIYGAVVAVFALIQDISANGKLYWIKTPHFGGWIYGPYVNHNHYAGLMEMLAPVPLVLVFNAAINKSEKRLHIICAALMSASLFLSESRGGLIAFTVELLVFAAFAARRRPQLRPTWIDGLLPLIMLALLVWLGGTRWTQRITSIHTEAQTELSGGVRMNVIRDGLRMARNKPFLGYGLGTFPEVYPRFRSFYSDVWINEAHNDYLQLLIETGLAGFAIMLWFLWTVYSNAARKLAGWALNLDGAVTLAAILGCTGILVHSLLDFNLHIPANAAIFYVLCCMAAMKSAPPHHSRREHSFRL